MSSPLRFPKRAWLLIPLCSLVFMAWSDHVRLHHVKFVTNVANEEARVDAASPTGYADGKRWLIVPEHNNPTYQWIEETQLMLARGDWRVRAVDYENAPFGREVHTASPYRWWLAFLAWLDRGISSRPIGLSVEHSALFADPLLQMFLLIGGTLFVARRFGALPAALFAAALASIFPFAAALLPGIANDLGLAEICALWSVLLLVAGAVAGPNRARWFFGAGCAGGCGLWLSASGQVPIIVGVAAGGILAALVTGRSPKEGPAGPASLPPWRAWAFGGAISSFLAYLVEYFPSHMEPQFRVNYPLYGLAWIGLGELLWRFASWMRLRVPIGGLRWTTAWVLSAAAVASLPYAIVKSGANAFLAGDLLSSRLTNLPNGAVASGVIRLGFPQRPLAGPRGDLRPASPPYSRGVAPGDEPHRGGPPHRGGRGRRARPRDGGARLAPAPPLEHARLHGHRPPCRCRGRQRNGGEPGAVRLARHRPPRAGGRARPDTGRPVKGPNEPRRLQVHHLRHRGPLRARPRAVDRRAARARRGPPSSRPPSEPRVSASTAACAGSARRTGRTGTASPQRSGS